ncbi:MAG TPA: BamA/TamA family outer membrane protein [Kofleriaceae bacterium]|jgi:outer membrane protein assembly factor BamA
MRRFAVVLCVQLVCAASARADEPVSAPEPAAEPLHEDNEFGPLISIEAIEISGNTATRTDIIRRALPIAPGDILHASDRRLRDTRFKVLALGYFRDVTLAMRKGSKRGQVVIEIHVVERGTFVLNSLWFGSTDAAPYWLGADIGERNLLGLGIEIGGGIVYAAPGESEDARAQWAGELRLADPSLYGSRWGAYGSLTLVHGSDSYRTMGTTSSDADDFQAFPYRRFGGRAGVTYDATLLSRISAGLRVEQISANLPVAPTQTLPGAQVESVDLHLIPGASRVVTLDFGFDRDTRADPILPHSGNRIMAAAEVGSATIGSDYDFASVFGRYEQWWPLRNERSAIGFHLAGGLVIGNAPRFDRIYIADVDPMLTPRALGLVLSNAAPLDILGTKDEKPTYGDLGGTATIEYTQRLFRGSGKNRVYGGDWFVAAGVWALSETDELRLRETSVWDSLPLDLFGDAGVRIDTDLGIFELTISNALGRIR